MKVLAPLGLILVVAALWGRASIQDSEKVLEGIDEDEIIRVIGPDQIRSIDKPKFVPADEAEIDDDDWVIGVEIDGVARAYSTNILNRHEIVNDTFGEKKIAVTW